MTSLEKSLPTSIILEKILAQSAKHWNGLNIDSCRLEERAILHILKTLSGFAKLNKFALSVSTSKASHVTINHVNILLGLTPQGIEAAAAPVDHPLSNNIVPTFMIKHL